MFTQLFCHPMNSVSANPTFERARGRVVRYPEVEARDRYVAAVNHVQTETGDGIFLREDLKRRHQGQLDRALLLRLKRRSEERQGQNGPGVAMPGR
jgi:hypothetical protein